MNDAHDRYLMRYFTQQEQKLVSVLADDKLKTTVTKMVADSFSQLPVLRRQLKSIRKDDIVGVVTWESIGEGLVRPGFDIETSRVRDFIEPIQKVYFCSEDDAIKDVTERMAYAEFAIILDSEKVVKRLVTHYDLASLYLNLVKPYSAIESIEGALRKIFASLSVDELREGSPYDYRRLRIMTVEDLEFSEYRTLLAKFWKRFDLRLDQGVLFEKLERINEIRNSVMHFRPEGVSSEDAKQLEGVKRMLGLI